MFGNKYLIALVISFLGTSAISNSYLDDSTDDNIAWSLSNYICRGVSDPNIHEPACEFRDALRGSFSAPGIDLNRANLLGPNAETASWVWADKFCRLFDGPAISEPACDFRDAQSERLKSQGFCQGPEGWVECTLAPKSLAPEAYTADDIPRIEALVALSDYLARPTEEQIPFYPYQRCSGLFLGYKYYTGATFDEETREMTELNIQNLRLAALLVEYMQLANRNGVSLNELPDELYEQITRRSEIQIESFAFFYDDRMADNYLKDGAAFSEDPLIWNDLTICGQYAQDALGIAEQFEALTK